MRETYQIVAENGRVFRREEIEAARGVAFELEEAYGRDFEVRISKDGVAIPREQLNLYALRMVPVRNFF